MKRKPRVRYQLSPSQAPSRRLEDIVARPWPTKSSILAAVLKSAPNSRGRGNADDQFGNRPDRLSKQLKWIERNSLGERERLVLLARFMLILNAPLLEGDDAMRAGAQARFATIIARVAQQVSSRRQTLYLEQVA